MTLFTFAYLQSPFKRWFFPLLSLLLMTALPAIGQGGSAAQHQRMADSLTGLFNQARFADIYACCNEDLKDGLTEKQLTDLLDKQLYKPHGNIQKTLPVRPDEGFYVYRLKFSLMSVEMSLGVDSIGKIGFIRFLPFKSDQGFKRLDYASSNPLKTAVDSLVNKIVQTHMQSPENCGLSIGVLRNDETFYYHYGETQRDNKILPNENTLYEIGSVTKTFCGLLLAQAVKEGKLKLNDDVRTYLPASCSGLKGSRSIITLAHLANHTSGLPRLPENMAQQANYNLLNPYKNFTREQCFNYLSSVKLQSEPGMLCDYSNLGMALLGMILEDVYHQSFEELVKTKIAKPARLLQTGVTLNEDQKKHFAQGYSMDGDAVPHWEFASMGAAGALCSNSGDMIRYLRYQLEESTPALKLSHQETFNAREKLALAWFIKKTNVGNTLYWHNGATYGFTSFAGFIPEKKCAVVVLCNSSTPVDAIAMALLNYLQR